MSSDPLPDFPIVRAGFQTEPAAAGTPLPAVLVGGPPHSGKSVLIYSLTQALRARGVQHYALRACPDGEGDWSNEAPQDLVREIRFKGQWTPLWVERVSRDIQRRHLPLLVDVGGRPTPEQAAMFSLCTHAVLLTPDDASQAWWRALAAQCGLPLLGDLRSDLHGANRLDAVTPLVQGVLAGLERNAQAQGPAFEALVERLSHLLAVDGADLRSRHLATAPAEIAVDLNRLARTLRIPMLQQQPRWAPEHVPLLVDYLPDAQPLAIYGRGVAWVIAALALLAHPAPFYNFDVRLGWVEAKPMRLDDAPAAYPLRFTVDRSETAFRVTAAAPDHYIEYDEIEEAAAPPAPAGVGVILSGKLPLWLFASLAITYHTAPWLAVYQPSLGGSVVVHSDHGRFPLGSVVTG